MHLVKLRMFLLCTLCIPLADLPAHTATHQRIDQLSAQIQAEPRAVTLYLKRAELYRAHRDWDNALKDYHKVATLEPNHAELDFYIGRMRVESDAAHLALPHLTRYLSQHPTHNQARLNRARAYARTNQPLLGVQDLDVLLRHTSKPSPEIYIERAQLLHLAGERYHAVALQGLTEAITRLGPLVSLVSAALDQCNHQADYRCALAFIERLPDNLKLTPKWLDRSGDLWVKLGDEVKGKQHYQRALQAIDQLPPTRQQTNAMHTLHTQLQKKLAALSNTELVSQPSRD